MSEQFLKPFLLTLLVSSSAISFKKAINIEELSSRLEECEKNHESSHELKK